MLNGWQIGLLTYQVVYYKMKRLEIILVGGGGHCKSCIDVIEADNKFVIKGIIDFPNLIGTTILGYPVIGNDDDLEKFALDGYSFLVTLGHMGNAKRRSELFTIIKKNRGNLPTIVSPNAYISEHSFIGEGTIVLHQAVINTGANIGANCIINTKALIEHDVRIDDDCHISTGAIINGNCTIASNCFIGSGSCIKNGLSVTNESFVGIGAVVVKTINEKGLYFGNPAKRVKNL